MRNDVMKNTRKAFTMIELVFVIVILGILSAVAIPRFSATRTDAHITKGKADIAAIRAAIINERQSRLFRGDPAFITNLAMDTGGLFGGVLPYPITAGTSDGKWAVTTAGTTYTFRIMGANNTFTYDEDNGTFLCTGGTHCSNLTN